MRVAHRARVLRQRLGGYGAVGEGEASVRAKLDVHGGGGWGMRDGGSEGHLQCVRRVVVLRIEKALPADALEIAGARARENCPLSFGDAVLKRADVLHHERSLTFADAADNACEPDEARRSILVRREEISN